MKAVLLTAYGDVDKLAVREVPDPKAGPNEIRVRVAGASINPVDWKQRSGLAAKFMPLDLPAILGRDASGEVIQVGAGVTAFEVGDKVLGRIMGGYAEQVVAPVDAWAKVPAKLDLADASALPLVVLTGAQLVEEAVNPKPGDLVLVTGALGGVGRTAVFAAKARGAKVYAGVRAKQRAEAAKLGADVVIALDDESDVAKLPPLDAIADTVGGETTQKLLGKLKPGGTVGSVVGEPPGAKERGFVVRAMMTHSDPKRLAELAQAVADGKLVIPIARRFPLDQAAEAQKVAEGHGGGKVVLLA
ncbi:MAG TPA: NADP-dependent oxidoreductase [Polyangia bacterium]|nr:NADP-dependent oxidoreductase [Polyangia bacterium]